MHNQGSSASLIELALIIVLIAIIVLAILFIIGDDLRLVRQHLAGIFSRQVIQRAERNRAHAHPAFCFIWQRPCQRLRLQGLTASSPCCDRAGRRCSTLVYPPCCPGCGAMGTVLCAVCQARIQSPPALACNRCWPSHHHGKPLPHLSSHALPSGSDRRQRGRPPLREAIHELKYNNGRSLARPLGARMAAYWQEHGFAADIIVPVPLHKARLAERGYNQAALSARVLGQATGIPLDEQAVVRHKATQQQTLLNAVERRENVKEAFTCRGDVARDANRAGR